MKRPVFLWILGLIVVAVLLYAFVIRSAPATGINSQAGDKDTTGKASTDTPPVAASSTSNTSLDTALYNQKNTHITNGDSSGKWPVKSAYPLAGAILPFKRIVAYYGNLYSKQMGILGELPRKQMLDKLQGEVKKWQAADSSIEVIPAKNVPLR